MCPCSSQRHAVEREWERERERERVGEREREREKVGEREREDTSESVLSGNISGNQESQQCDQIGRFLKVFGDRFSYKRWPKYLMTFVAS